MRSEAITDKSDIKAGVGGQSAEEGEETKRKAVWREEENAADMERKGE